MNEDIRVNDPELQARMRESEIKIQTYRGMCVREREEEVSGAVVYGLKHILRVFAYSSYSSFYRFLMLSQFLIHKFTTVPTDAHFQVGNQLQNPGL